MLMLYIQLQGRFLLMKTSLLVDYNILSTCSNLLNCIKDSSVWRHSKYTILVQLIRCEIYITVDYLCKMTVNHCTCRKHHFLWVEVQCQEFELRCSISWEELSTSRDTCQIGGTSLQPVVTAPAKGIKTQSAVKARIQKAEKVTQTPQCSLKMSFHLHTSFHKSTFAFLKK